MARWTAKSSASKSSCFCLGESAILSSRPIPPGGDGAGGKLYLPCLSILPSLTTAAVCGPSATRPLPLPPFLFLSPTLPISHSSSSYSKPTRPDGMVPVFPSACLPPPSLHIHIPCPGRSASCPTPVASPSLRSIIPPPPGAPPSGSAAALADPRGLLPSLVWSSRCAKRARRWSRRALVGVNALSTATMPTGVVRKAPIARAARSM